MTKPHVCARENRFKIWAYFLGHTKATPFRAQPQETLGKDGNTKSVSSVCHITALHSTVRQPALPYLRQWLPTRTSRPACMYAHALAGVRGIGGRGEGEGVVVTT